MRHRAEVVDGDQLEQELRESVMTVFDKLDVHFLSIDQPAPEVLEARILLPKWQDRALRHDVIEALNDFEEQLDHRVSVNPAWVWNADDAHDD